MLLTTFPKPKSEPLFSRTLGPFNKRWLADNLSTALLRAGYDPTNYLGYSFRRGAANTAVAAGISRENVKLLGRWKSDAVDRYFTKQTTNTIAFSANKQLHMAPSQRKTALILRSAPQPPANSFNFLRSKWPSREVARQLLWPPFCGHESPKLDTKGCRI